MIEFAASTSGIGSLPNWKNKSCAACSPIVGQMERVRSRIAAKPMPPVAAPSAWSAISAGLPRKAMFERCAKPNSRDEINTEAQIPFGSQQPQDGPSVQSLLEKRRSRIAH